MAMMAIAGRGRVIYLNARLHAIPGRSDVQVMGLTHHPGQVPQVVEQQLAYPLTTAMLAVPKT